MMKWKSVIGIVLIGASVMSLCGCGAKTLETDNGEEEIQVYSNTDLTTDDIKSDTEPYVSPTGPVGYGEVYEEPDGRVWNQGFLPDFTVTESNPLDFYGSFQEGDSIGSSCAEYDISRLSFTADDISIDGFDSGCYVTIHVLNISDRQIMAEVLDGMVRYQKLKGNESEPFIHKMYQGTDLVDIPADYMLEPDESVDIVAYMPDVKKGYITFQQLDGVAFIRKIGE